MRSLGAAQRNPGSAALHPGYAYLSNTTNTVLVGDFTLRYEEDTILMNNAWSELHMQRNLTSHTYDQKLAESVYVYLKERGLQLFIDLKNSLNER